MNSLGYSAAGSGTIDIGTPGTGVTAVTHGDGFTMVTELTLAGVLPAITGDTNQAVGLLIFTLPDGNIEVGPIHMKVGITQSQGNITSDDPDVGIGKTIATGANALLSANAAFENYITGQTAGDCSGTVTDAFLASTAGGPVLIADGETRTIHLNAADIWDAAAGGDTAAALSGTVTIPWRFLGT